MYPPSNAAAGSTSFRGDAKPYRGHKVAIKSPQKMEKNHGDKHQPEIQTEMGYKLISRWLLPSKAADLKSSEKK